MCDIDHTSNLAVSTHRPQGILSSTVSPADCTQYGSALLLPSVLLLCKVASEQALSQAIRLGFLIILVHSTNSWPLKVVMGLHVMPASDAASPLQRPAPSEKR